MNKDHFTKLKNMYLSAKMTQEMYQSTQIEIEEKRAEIRLQVEEKYFHALNAMHGAVYFKLLDDAAYFAVNSVVEDAFVLTTSFNIHFVRPVKSGEIKAVGRLKFAGKNLFIAEASLYDERGKEIGFGTGNFAKSKVMLNPEIGYSH